MRRTTGKLSAENVSLKKFLVGEVNTTGLTPFKSVGRDPVAL